MKPKLEQSGWVGATMSHPNTGRPMISGHTFSYFRKEAIEKFIDFSGKPWRYWREKYGFKTMKATQTVELL